MEKKLLSTQEVMRVQANMQKIEFHLGRPIPQGLLDVTEYSDHILSQKEVDRIVANMTKVGYSAPMNKFETFLATYVVLPIFVIGIIMMIIENILK